VSAPSFADYRARVEEGVTIACKSNGAQAPKRFLWDPSEKVSASVLGFKIEKEEYSTLKVFVSDYKQDRIYKYPSEIAKHIYAVLKKPAGEHGFEKYKPVGVWVFTAYLPSGTVPKQ
jgi:hypothetical protein